MFNFKYEKPLVVAEIGCNHMGNLDIAKELIRDAKDCKADFAKFQKRNPRALLNEDQFNAPHPEPWQSYGATYGQHREYLEFNLAQHAELKNYAESIGIGYSTSVWDITSAQEIISLQPEYIKIPSACNTNIALLTLLRDAYSGDVHVAVGMTLSEEIATIVDLFSETGVNTSRLVLYSCTSGYPIAANEICLLEINKLYQLYGNKVKAIGFSGHHLGIAPDIAAYTLGAKWIERHFTKDRTWKGTDHAASLEVPGMQKLVRDLHNTYLALQYKEKEILDVEQFQRNKLKKNN